MKSQLIPNIRFSSDEKPWIKRPVGDFVKIKSGLGFKASEYTEEGIRLLQIENVSYGEVKWIKPQKLPEEYLKSYPELVLEEGDLVLALNRPVTNNQLKISQIRLKDSPAILYQRVGKLIFDKEEYSSAFIEQVFSHYVKAFVLRESIGSDQPFISLTALYKYKIPLPSGLNERNKIAGFLSSVDKKIALLKAKHDLLAQYKKGVMQKLFSQEIRFKDEASNDFPDWQAKVVGDFMVESRIKGNNGLTAKKITVKLWGKGVYEKNEKISGSENTQYYQRKSGQFIYSKLDFLNCAFGLIPEYLDNYETTVDLPCFDVADGINKYLILELIKQKRFYKKYGDMADGSRKAKRIHAKDFLSFPINLPCENEQNKIADFLQALDKKLNLVSEQVARTQTFKKGLLQQMFV